MLGFTSVKQGSLSTGSPRKSTGYDESRDFDRRFALKMGSVFAPNRLE
jgi:hypothetical protein